MLNNLQIQKVKEEQKDIPKSENMEKQIEEITELCKKFNASLTTMEKNQKEVTQFVI